MSKFFLLVIDDDLSLLEVLKNDLEPLGFEILTASTTDEATALISSHASKLVLILCDYQLAGMTGLEYRRLVFEKSREIPFILISGIISKQIALSALDLKITAFIEKPYTEEALRALITKESQYRIDQLKEEEEKLKEEAEILEAFTKDAELLLEEAENITLDLESNPEDLSGMDRLCAIVHTIKGSSGFFQPPTVNKFAHRYEDFIVPFKKGQVSLDPRSVSVLLKGLDTLKTLIKALKEGRLAEYRLEELLTLLEKGQEGAVPKTQSVNGEGGVGVAPGDVVGKPQASQNREDIRVSIKVLDEFMELSGELTVIRNMLYKVVQTVERELPSNRNIAQLSELFGELHHINSQMQDKVLDLRKVPLQSILRPLQRTIRDLSQSLNKPLSLHIEGGELRVDTALAEVLNNSLIHMIRNSADHGIETSEIRKARNKPALGTLKFSAHEELNEIVVKLSDDGNGIDSEIIRKKIVEKGLRTFEQAQKMGTSELQNMIFEPGFSTAKQVTDVSGRGVGMDMVKKSITKIGGSIEIVSKVGEGSTFILHLPIPKTVLIIPSLLVQAGNQIFAIPQEKISRLMTVPPAEHSKFLRMVEGGTCLLLGGEVKPLLSLGQFLSPKSQSSGFLSTFANDEEVKIILVEGKNSEFGIVVDEIFDLEDTVVKKLGSHLRSLDIYLGATYLGDGAIGLVLNIEGIESNMHIKESSSLKSHRVDSLESHSMELKQSRDVLTFKLGSEGTFGLYLSDIFRIEEVSQKQIQREDSLLAVVYRDQIMPLVCLSSLLEFRSQSIFKESRSVFPTLVVKHGDGFIGLGIDLISDLVSSSSQVDTELSDPKGVLGSSIINEETVTLVDLNRVLDRVRALQTAGLTDG